MNRITNDARPSIIEALERGRLMPMTIQNTIRAVVPSSPSRMGIRIVSRHAFHGGGGEQAHIRRDKYERSQACRDQPRITLERGRQLQRIIRSEGMLLQQVFRS